MSDKPRVDQRRYPIDLSLDKVVAAYQGEKVGTLALTDSQVLAFEYDADWLVRGFSISPFSLPLESGVFIAKPHPLDGVFGVFDDSLPDGWGRLLVDRVLRNNGIDPDDAGPLVRLAIVGNSGMGALEYRPVFSFPDETVLEDYDRIANDCAQMLKTDFTEDIDALFAMGGSSGGARPKILTEIDGRPWIVKFPSSYDSRDIGVHEYKVALAARECGIDVPEVRLLPSKQCGGYFAVRRFDRPINQHGGVTKVHMISAGALLETSHRIPNLDYDILLKLTLRLTDDIEEVERLFRLMVFNVMIGNRDDHAKNFSYLREPFMGSWCLSPAYDLTRNGGMNGERATTVNGKGRDITTEDMTSVGVRAGLPSSRIRSIINRVHETLKAADLLV